MTSIAQRIKKKFEAVSPYGPNPCNEITLPRPYWVARSSKPVRNLCDDGVIRKSLKNAPPHVEFMKWFQEPTYEQIQEAVDKDNDNRALGFIERTSLMPLKITPDDYHNKRTGKVYHNGMRDIQKKIIDSGLFEV